MYISNMYMYIYIYVYVILYRAVREQQWCGYQARAQAIAHLKPHPTPASEDDRLGGDDDDDDDEGGDVGDEGIYDDGDGDFVQVMIFLPLLCYVRVTVTYTDLHWDGPASDTGVYMKRKQKNKHFIFFQQHSVCPGRIAFYMR